MLISTTAQLDDLRFGPDGLLPLIAQDARTGEVLMLAWSNRTALERTLEERRVWFWSRSRNTLWRKGETSGNELSLHSLHADCDADTLLALVEPAGPACHTGARSCFEAAPILVALGDIIRARQSPASPAAVQPTEQRSYTRRLLEEENLRLKKLGEEAVELALACARGDSAKAAEEAADLVYHLLVACAAVGVSESAITAELAWRRTAAL